MSKEYDMVFHAREEAKFDMDRLLIPLEQLQDRLDYLEKERNPQFGQYWNFPKENNIHTVRGRLDFALAARKEAPALEPAA